VQICLCHVNVAIDLPGLPQIPAPVTDQSCAATSSANTLIGVGGPHPPPSCANLHSARRSRRHRLPFPAGSFIEGFRTPATVQAASLRSAGIRNPQHKQSSHNATFGDSARLAGDDGTTSSRRDDNRSRDSRSSNAAFWHTNRLAIHDGIGRTGIHGDCHKQREPSA